MNTERKPDEERVAGSSPEDDLQRQILNELTTLQTKMQSVEDRLLSKMNSGFARIDEDLTGVRGDVAKLRAQVADLDVASQRQERRLGAIESFPSPPIRQPSRLYATEAQSVSLPKRVRVGRAG